MGDLLIKNGKIVTAVETYNADIAVRSGKIAAIGTDFEEEDFSEIVDAKDRLVLPGAIDGHTHLALAFGGATSSDNYYTGTRAAACGGTTTVFDFAQQEPGERFLDAVKRRDVIASRDAAIDYSFHIGVGDVSTEELLDSMEEAVEYGITSFKVYMVYNFGVDDGSFYKVLEKSKILGALVGVHAENKDVSSLLVKQYLSEGKVSPWWHYMSKNEMVEGEADVRAISLAKMADAPLYIVHLADKMGMEAVTEARRQGYPIFAETCPQYLHFTNEVYKRERARDFVCSPPMKNQESQDALWAGIANGNITTIATDHCPFKAIEKDWGVIQKDGALGNFTTIPNGCAGVENMYPYMLSQAVCGRISFNKAVQLCAFNPSKLFGLNHKKGGIRVGLDADLVIYDPQREVTISNKGLHSATDHTIWEGVKLKGYPQATYSRGRLVYKEGAFLGSRGGGQLIKCNKLKFRGPEL